MTYDEDVTFFLLTSICFRQIQEPSVGVGCVLHNLLDLLLTQDTVLHTVMCLNDDHADRSHAQKVSNLESVGSRRVLPVAEEPACTGVTGEGFGGWDDPKVLPMGRDEQLTCSSIRQFVTLQFPSNMRGVFRPEVNGVGVAATVRTLNDDTLREWYDKEKISKESRLSKSRY
jgi:hypothetical protein